MSLRLIDGSEFLHIPKTGGSWVSAVLQEAGLVAKQVGSKHANFDLNLFYSNFGDQAELASTASVKDLARHLAAAALRKKVPGRSSAPFRFCFVRHPLKWYESWWKYMQGLGWKNWGRPGGDLRDWHPNTALNGLGSDNFNEFVENVLRNRPGYVSELYYSFVKPGISFVGKTESLRSDLAYVVSERLGLRMEEPSLKRAPINVSKTPAEEPIWDAELKKSITILELPALLHFDYISAQELRELGIDPARYAKAARCSVLRREAAG